MMGLGEMTNLFFSALTWRIFIGFSWTGLAIGDEHRGLQLWCDLIGRTFVIFLILRTLDSGLLKSLQMCGICVMWWIFPIVLCLDKYEFSFKWTIMSLLLFCSYFWVQTPRGWDKDNILVSNYTIRLWFDKFYTFYDLWQWYHFTRGVQINHWYNYPMPTRSPLDSKLQSVCRQSLPPTGQVAGFLLQEPTNDILESGDLHHRPN